MKFLLSIKILLICATFVLSDGSPSLVPSEKEITGLLERWNDKRGEMADRINVANMNELKWNDNLAKSVPELNCDDKDLEEQLSQYRNHKKDSIGDLSKTLQSFPDSMAECWNPVKTQIGCKEKVCGPTWMNCRCGPKKPFSNDDIKEGKPGSKCDNGAEGRLCVANGSQVSMSILTRGALNLIIFYWVFNMM